MKESLKNSLNGLREVTSEIFHQYVPVITDDMDINSYASPILKDINLSNEFLSVLINRIVYTAIETKMFNNPLNGLKGEAIPLGYAGQEIYTNPAKGRRFNDNDFAGLLFKYEADVKIQYTYINQDIQYPVTVSQKAFKKAFVSWADLEKFINNLTTSLYNGAYIDEFKFTKYLVANAYRTGAAPVVITPEIQEESDAKEVVKIARKLYLDMQLPSEQFNAWKNVGGYGRPVTTWTEADDIVLLLRNDVRNEIDVDVLAQAFNIDKATLLGNILPIDNFDIYDDDGEKIFDGSSIYGMIGDRKWFRIKNQDLSLDTFFNANNKTWQYYLNDINMFNFSLFANGVILAKENPTLTINSLKYDQTSIDVPLGKDFSIEVKTDPYNATSPTISYTSSATEVFTVQADSSNNKVCKITPVKKGIGTITATAGNVSTAIVVNIVDAVAS